jgi:glycosyltransferase involved in cell wall biosynthesis
MPRIFLDTEKLKSPNSGLGQFCAHLGKAIEKSSKEEIGFYVDPEHLTFFETKNILLWKRSHQYLGVSVKTNLWHSMHQEAKYFPKDKATKILLTIHDLNFLDKYTDAKRERKLKNLQKLVNKVSGIAYISEFTKKIAEQHLKLPDVPQKVIYNGVSVSDVKPIKPVFVDHDDAFIFSIGIIGEKKNFHVLVEAMKELTSLKLFLCGNASSKYADKIRALITKHKLEKRVVITGEVSESEKNWMFINSKAFVFPSLSEGFGLPVVEAMYFGKPVVLSKLTSLPEIGGEEAVYLDNFLPEEIASKIDFAIKNHTTEKIKALKNRASLFSWQKAAEQYLEIYNTILRKIN